MRPHAAIVAVIAALLASALACQDDDPMAGGDCVGPDCPGRYGDLSSRYHVLKNLELSYRQRNITRYEELLDQDFTFFFEEGDVGGGIPEQWGRAEEVDANTRLLDRNLNDPNFPRCKSIKMDLDYEEGVLWTPVTPSAYPDETWYKATVSYDFQFDVEPDVTYIPGTDAKGIFIIRNTGTDSAPRWKLVEFRDLGSPWLYLTSTSVPATTWGRIKALYR